jgi:hypothetical protein
MPNRDVWKHGSGRLLQDLLSSALLTLLLPGSEGRAIYFASPWMSDFALFDNAAREVADLFPDQADQERVSFIDFLAAVSVRHDVRIVTVSNRTSDAFLERLRPTARHAAGALRARIAPQETHEKGILAPGFYIDGSMNITHMGVHVNGEKIAYHASGTMDGARVHAAYLEFDRQWRLLESTEVRW